VGNGYMKRRRVEGFGRIPPPKPPLIGGGAPSGPSRIWGRTPLSVRRKSLIERIAGAADGADRVGFATAVEGAAEAADVDVDGAFVDIDVIAPDAIEQLFARIDTARMAHEIFEQAVFGRAQV